MIRKIGSVIVAILLASQVLAKQTVFLGQKDTHFIVPKKWQLVETPSSNLPVFLYEDGVSKIQLIVYPQTGVSRANTVFDGWISFGSRVGTAYETQRAGADKLYIGVYGKDLIESPGDRQLVADYSFVKNKVVYVVEISTLQSKWPLLESSVRQFLDYFWIGTGKRPVAQPTVWKLNWQRSEDQILGMDLYEDEVMLQIGTGNLCMVLDAWSGQVIATRDYQFPARQKETLPLPKSVTHQLSTSNLEVVDYQFLGDGKIWVVQSGKNFTYSYFSPKR